VAQAHERRAPWTAAILAGGQARRLGGIDKGALPIGSASILERQLALVRGLTPHVLVVAGTRSPLGADAARVVPDRIRGAGALGGIYTALVEAPTEQVLVIACDMPFLTAPFLARLADAGRTSEVAVPRDNRGRHPLCASYHRRIAEQLKSRIDRGELRVGDALEGLTVREIGPDELSAFDVDGRLLLNVNTPADYEQARTLTSAR
jgi:molybdopterin-guanine dinucleotide biosynthesis protein A